MEDGERGERENEETQVLSLSRETVGTHATLLTDTRRRVVSLTENWEKKQIRRTTKKTLFTDTVPCHCVVSTFSYRNDSKNHRYKRGTLVFQHRTTRHGGREGGQERATSRFQESTPVPSTDEQNTL